MFSVYFINKIKFDLIFADPPYDLEQLEEIPDLIFKYGLLKFEGLLVLEHSIKIISKIIRISFFIGITEMCILAFSCKE